MEANLKTKRKRKRHWRGGARQRRKKKRLINGREFVSCCFCERLLHKDSKELTLEHIIPRANGGKDGIQNLTLSCYNCNNSRGSKNFEEFHHRKLMSRIANTSRHARGV